MSSGKTQIGLTQIISVFGFLVLSKGCLYGPSYLYKIGLLNFASFSS